MKATLLLAIAMLVAPLSAAAQSLSEDPRVAEALHLLERWADAQQAYHQIPGVSLAVVHDQELVWSGGFGYANLENETPTTAETIYSICSVSKLFTSIGVMQLRDQGYFGLHDAAGDLLPWFDIQQRHTGSPAITVQGLLTHSAGLPRESAHPYWSAPDFPFPTREEVVADLSGQETLYPASTYFQYSNLGMTLLGEIVAEVSGQPYEAYVQEHILDPLGLGDTRTELPEELAGGRLATGYSALTREGTRDEVPLFQARGIVAAAGFSSTVEDLARFASWQFRLLEDGGEDLLHANTLREMHRVHWVDPDWDTTWGLGFVVSRRGDNTVVGHGGNCPGYRTAFDMQPERKLAAVAMANANGVNTGTFSRAAFEILGPAIEKALNDPDGATQPDPSLDFYTGTYSSAPWGGEMEVLSWEGGLALVSLPTDQPMEALTRLTHVEEHTFRRVRDDGELGEEISFEVDDEGNVTHLVRHNNNYPRVP